MKSNSQPLKLVALRAIWSFLKTGLGLLSGSLQCHVVVAAAGVVVAVVGFCPLFSVENYDCLCKLANCNI